MINLWIKPPSRHVLFFLWLLLLVGIAKTGSSQSSAYRTTIEDIGDVIQLTLPATGFVSSLIDGDKKSTKEFALSFLTTVAVTHGLKAIIHKKRPGTSMEYNALPSGHTSASFHGAAYIQRKYGWIYGIPAYALAGFVGYSRIEGINRRHDGWDVLAGAALGISTAYLFVKPLEKHGLQVHISKVKDDWALGMIWQLK